MTEVTLTIPAEYVEAYRDAVLIELESDGRRLIDLIHGEQRDLLTNRAEIEEATQRRFDEIPATRGISPEDILDTHRCTAEDIRLLTEVLCDIEGDLTVTAEIEAVWHSLETLTDKVLVPKLTEAANYAPMHVAGLRAMTEAINWAADEYVRIEAVWNAEREGAVA